MKHEKHRLRTSWAPSYRLIAEPATPATETTTDRGQPRREPAARSVGRIGAGAVPAHWLIVTAILALAAVLRFDALTGRGFIHWDEGKFALEGVRLWSVLSSLSQAHPVVAGKAIGTAKPTHALLIALSYRVLGVHDYAPLLLNAAASVLAVAVLCLWARRLFGAGVGLIAALFLAVSGYDIIYARSALSESDADLFFLAGAFLWWRASETSASSPRRTRWIRHVYAGGLMGAAFTTNYRLIVYIATFVVIDIVAAWKRGDGHDAAACTAAGIAGIALLPALWQALGVLAAMHGVVLFRTETTYGPTSYASEVLYQLHGGKQSILQFRALPYLQWYEVRQGWPLSLLLLLGFGVAARERSYRLLLPASLVLVPSLAYTFAPFIVPRNLDAALPFTAVLSAAGLTSLTRWIRNIRVARLLVVTAALGCALLECIRVWPLTGMRSGFPAAAAYVERRGGGALVVNEVMRFYLRGGGQGCQAPRLPRTLADLAGAARVLPRYAVVDDYSRPLARYLARHADRVAQYPQVNAAPMGENLIASEGGNPPVSHTIGRIDVYALHSLRLPSSRTGRRLTCNLDQLA